MRAFFAIPVGRLVDVDAVAEDFRGSGRALRWVPAHQIHLTLRFLGEIAGDEVSCMQNKLHETAACFPPFSLEWDRTGVFPHWRSPRVFWIGLQRKSAQTVTEIARRLGESSVRPHVTVARLKGEVSLSVVKQWRNYHVEWSPAGVTELLFMKSTLTSEGAVHQTISRGILGR